MPSEPKQQCPGGATYRIFEDGRIEINGNFTDYSSNQTYVDKITKIWEKYGKELDAAASDVGIPVAWMVGLMVIESGGDPWACSPCSQPYCSFAPNCPGGVASNGKYYSCCAFGLMQFIDSTAKLYGHRGWELMGNPALALLLAAKLFKSLVDKSEGDPLVAARRYNGCGGCKGGQAPCGGGGIFGIGGQHNYVEKFALVANTFMAMGLKRASILDTRALVAAIFFGLGAATFGYYKPSRDFVDRIAKKLSK